MPGTRASTYRRTDECELYVLYVATTVALGSTPRIGHPLPAPFRLKKRRGFLRSEDSMMDDTSQIPESYREWIGCHSCSHVFVESDYDTGDTHYCTYGAPDRPLCGSVSMDEMIGSDNEARQRWYEWSECRRVRPWGACDQYKAPNPNAGA